MNETATSTEQASSDTRVQKRLASLGVYGFDRFETVILAALVTEDPLLLIGLSGTGKTFLLNTLSEVLGLEHRHYNASMVSFDDLVGFPYPDKEGGAVKFLETPATVWGAESVLVDEISRCKPEHQNRLFALVHERKVQGLPLTRLRYRWAAMNPCSADQSSADGYTGSEPLDPALADRFALFVESLDWAHLTEDERDAVANPGGEGRVANDDGSLARDIASWRETFLQKLDECPAGILSYCTTAATALNGTSIRVSPRRVRLLARSLLAALIIDKGGDSELFRTVLECSLPHVTWGERARPEVVAAAHRLAWDAARSAERQWIHVFMAEPRLSRKLSVLVDRCKSSDAGSQAIAQLIASESKARAAAFAFATFPAAVRKKLPIGAEGMNDLGKLATPALFVSGTISWEERVGVSGSHHPDFERYGRVLNNLAQSRARLERAHQFFNWCIVAKVDVTDPAALECEIEECVELLRTRGLT